MTPEHVFALANTVALIGWVLLIALPRQRWVSELVAPRVLPALFAGVYVAILAMFLKGSSGGFSSLSAVATLFTQPWLLLAGWVHYLAFDLIVGSWEVSDARERGIPYVAVVPCLVLTFMFGPAGWLAYSGVRAAYARRAQDRSGSSRLAAR
jgi:Domain of unknown function (DUF4281)